MMISSSRTRLLLLALFAVVMIAVVALSTNADAGARVPGDATCNGIVNESDLLPALEEFAGIGEGAAGCPENVNVICTNPLDFRDLLALLSLLADVGPGVTFCVATPTPGPTGTPSTATVTPTATPQGTPGTATPGSGTPGTVTPGTTATPGPSVTPTVTPAATPTPSPSPSPTPQICDGGLASNSLIALDAAKAIGVCAPTSASWLKPDDTSGPGTPAFNNGHSIRPKFGSIVQPQEGSRLLVLSSGAAAAVGDTSPNWVDPHDIGVNKSYTSAYPAGFPKTSPDCPSPSGSMINDGIAFQMVVTAPPGASAFSVDWKFYSDDYPAYVCTAFMDMAAITANGLDVDFIDVTDPRIDQCENGPTGQSGNIPRNKTECISMLELQGTGYDVHTSNNPSIPDEGAGTSWMTSISPVTPGVGYTIKFMIWDTSDSRYDSTMLVDNFHWLYD